MTHTFIDYSNELTSSQFYLEELAADGSNYSAVVGGIASNRALMGTANALITKCEPVKQNISVVPNQSAISAPTDAAAQRELALRVIYQDQVTMRFGRVDIPAPVDLLFDNGSDEVDILSNVTFLAWSAVFEANCVSQDGNAIVVTRAYLVGRRN